MLPLADGDYPLAKVALHHDTRVLAGVFSYKVLKALRLPASMMREAKRYGVTYNRLEKMCTAAKYRGGGQAKSSAGKRKSGTDPTEAIDPDEEDQEEKEAREPPTELREQPDRRAKSKSPDKKKRKQTMRGEQEAEATWEATRTLRGYE